MPDYPIFTLIDGFVGNGFNDFGRRLYTHEAVALKAALRQVPEELWAGEWDAEDLDWVASEVREIFPVMTNAEALERFVAGLTRRAGEAELSEIAQCQAVFVRQFRGLVGNDQNRLRRMSFVKAIFTLIITCRRFPILIIVSSGCSKHCRESEMERDRSRRGFQLVSSS